MIPSSYTKIDGVATPTKQFSTTDFTQILDSEILEFPSFKSGDGSFCISSVLPRVQYLKISC